MTIDLLTQIPTQYPILLLVLAVILLVIGMKWFKKILWGLAVLAIIIAIVLVLVF